MKPKLTLLALVSVILFYSCAKKEEWIDTTTHDNILYNGFMKFTVNGVKIENTGSGFQSGGNNGVGMVKDTADATLTRAKASYTIFTGNCPGTRYCNNGPFNMLQFELYTDSLTVGTYAIKDAQSTGTANGHVVYIDNNLVSYDNKDNAFVISIKRHSNGVLEGTFSGTLYNETKSVTITEGSFITGTLYR